MICLLLLIANDACFRDGQIASGPDELVLGAIVIVLKEA